MPSPRRWIGFLPRTGERSKAQQALLRSEGDACPEPEGIGGVMERGSLIRAASPPRLEEPLDPRLGEVVAGRYRVLRPLGEGGMGRVYYAEHATLRKPFALKFLHPGLSRDRELVRRFDREAKLMSRLAHPHCVNISDFGETLDGLLYLAME